MRIFNKEGWIGPIKILSVNNDIISTSHGIFKNVSDKNLIKNYTYLLRIDGSNIIDVGMSCSDIIIFIKDKTTKVLSIKRGKEPFKGMWANPGGNIDEGESPLDAAVRELEEETGLMIPGRYFTYIDKFDDDWRDPRNKNCVSYAFAIFLDETPKVIPADDACDFTWNDIDENGDVNVDMAFDHAEIIKKSFLHLNFLNK